MGQEQTTIGLRRDLIRAQVGAATVQLRSECQTAMPLHQQLVCRNRSSRQAEPFVLLVQPTCRLMTLRALHRLKKLWQVLKTAFAIPVLVAMFVIDRCLDSSPILCETDPWLLGCS